MRGITLSSVVATAGIFLVLAVSLQAQAQPFPDRPVRLVVGFPPGGSSDTVARLVAQHLSPLIGQPVVVENKPGAGGVIGSDIVAKAPADGHTLLLATSSNATTAAVMKSLPFDPLNGFAWITTITTYPFVIATGAGSPIKDLPDLIARAKAAPGRLSYLTAGVGTSHHLLGEWFSAESGVDMLHVPFKGGASQVGEVVAGRVDVMFETMTLALPHIRSGRLRGLAVTSPEAMDYLPEVPPLAQSVKGLVFQSWLGIAAPGGTPPATVQRLNRDLRVVLSNPDVQQRLAALGGRAAPVTPEQMRAHVQTEIERWRGLVERRHIEKQ